MGSGNLYIRGKDITHCTHTIMRHNYSRIIYSGVGEEPGDLYWFVGFCEEAAEGRRNFVLQRRRKGFVET